MVVDGVGVTTDVVGEGGPGTTLIRPTCTVVLPCDAAVTTVMLYCPTWIKLYCQRVVPSPGSVRLTELKRMPPAACRTAKSAINSPLANVGGLDKESKSEGGSQVIEA